MNAGRRRTDDPGTRRSSYRRLYATAGALLGLGSPLGALALRGWLAHASWTPERLGHELWDNVFFYAYMTLGTSAAFAAFGWFLGARSERQRDSNRELSRRVDELHAQSVTDALTGVYTHGHLYELLERELRRAAAERSPLAVLIADLDDFKRVNDTRGHLAGDKVLKETAETLAAHVRAGDLLGRYGGDEFVVIMPGTDAATALRAAQRVCSAVERYGAGATVSVGVAASALSQIRTPDELLQEADANLYRAKHQGRNRVCGGAPPPAAPPTTPPTA